MLGSEEGQGCKGYKGVGCRRAEGKGGLEGKQASSSSARGIGTKAGARRGNETAEAAAAGSDVTATGLVTVDHLKLLLELLLLIWPSTKRQAQDVDPVKPQGWLLLLAALLQQAPSAVKLQLLEQRGTLLLQLLYQVMLEGECEHSRHPEDAIQAVMEASCDVTAALLGKDSNSSSTLPLLGTPVSARPARPVGMVLLVLQSLLYESVPVSLLAESMPLQPSRMYTIGEVLGREKKPRVTW
jgi:hypothetical protein